MTEFQPPPFVPHRWLRNGHLQTLVSVRSTPAEPLNPQRYHVEVSEGDCIALHEDSPPGWRSGHPSMLLVHGLSGCHAAPYMLRLASRFLRRGVRVFRMDMRGCGAAAKLSRHVTHAGRSEDIMAALQHVAERTDSGPMMMTAISMGGNQALRAMGRVGSGDEQAPPWFDRMSKVAVVAPPIDLARCSRNMNRFRMRLYNYYFIRSLLSRVPEQVSAREDFQRQRRKGRPRTLWELDDQITAPLSGFRDAAEYYNDASSKWVIEHLPVPTLVLVAEDDPLVPIGCFVDESAKWSPHAKLVVSPTGGHVGFIDRKGECWMDEVIASWFID
ncbi:MAG: alpha/beta fold hydrolase [Planctomycetota bacterium]